MSEQTFANEPVSGPTVAIGETSALPDSKLAAQRFADDLAHIAIAIALASAAYPIILAIGLLIVGFALFGINNLTWNELDQALAATLGSTFVGTIIGLFWGGFVAIATLPLVYFFVRSFGLRVCYIRLGAFCGGLVGFVAVMPFIFFVGSDADPLGLIVLLAVGPALATVVSQVGGAWGGYRVRREHGIDMPSRTGRIQFGIRHIMVACVWIALLLTAIRLSGLDFLLVLLLLFGWLVYQAATLWIGGLLARWFRRWKAERQTRST